jgi:hypothetical protein
MAPRSRSGTARSRNSCWLIGVVRSRPSLPTMTRCAARCIGLQGGGRQSGEADNRRAILLNQHVQFISNGAKVPVQDLHECVPPGSLVGEDSSTIERITAETQQIPIAKIVQRLRHQ